MSSLKEQCVSRVWPKAVATLLFAATVAACSPQPGPRSVLDFMEDGLARDGVLTRCNSGRDDGDVECANARRAAATLAIEAERERSVDFERAVFGTPVGRVMPSMTELDVFAESEPLGRHNVEVAAAEPPTNEIAAFAPEIELADVAVIPRPFRTDDVAPPR
jgi:hypothetical protein